MAKKLNEKTVNALKTTATIGLFATGIYFLFFKGNKAFGQGLFGMKDKSDMRSDVSLYPAYLGRQEFPYEYLGKQKVIRGFSLPQDVNRVQMVNNHIEAIVLPSGKGLFDDVNSGQRIKLYKVGNSFVKGSGQDAVQEKYEDLVGNIVLTKNIYIKNFQVDSQL